MSVDKDLKMATGDYPRKHSRPGIRFQMEFNFEDNGSKKSSRIVLKL